MKAQEFLRKSALIVVLATLACLAGCGKGERIKAPPLNDHPIEKITFVVDIKNAQAEEIYKVEGANVYYTTPTPGCGRMDYMAAIGGIYKRPEASIYFQANKNKITIYRDYFKLRQKCPFIIDQVIINISDRIGRNAAVNINSLVIGSDRSGHIKSRCEFEPTLNYYLCYNNGWSGFERSAKRKNFTLNIRRLQS